MRQGRKSEPVKGIMGKIETSRGDKGGHVKLKGGEDG